MATFYVYILFSPSIKQFYKGQTADIHKRMIKHNSGYEISTKNARPWILLWKTEKNSRGDAIQLERKLKNLSNHRLISFMKKYSHELTYDLKKLFPDS